MLEFAPPNCLCVCWPDPDEQREIVAILDAIDRKIDLHRKKRAVLNELFEALLHKLMTGEIRVADLDLSALDRRQVSETRAPLSALQGGEGGAQRAALGG
jgi:hypothetical protein